MGLCQSSGRAQRRTLPYSPPRAWGRFTGTETQKGPYAFPLCPRELFAASHFYQQLCNGQKQAARGEQHPQHPAPWLRQTSGRLLVPRVPCPLLGDQAQGAPGPTAARDQGAELGHGRAKRDVRAFPCSQGNSPGSCTPPRGGMLPFGLASHTEINHLHIGQTSKNVDWEVLRALMRGKLMSPAALGKQGELCRRQKTCNACTKERGAETCKHPRQPKARHRAPDFRQNL